MCEFLVVGNTSQVERWFEQKSIVENVHSGRLVFSARHQVLEVLKVAKPKVVLIADHEKVQELKTLVWETQELAQVVIVGEKFTPQKFQMALEMGAEDYCVPPLNIEQLRRFIKRPRKSIQIRSLDQLRSGNESTEMVIGSNGCMVDTLRTASLVAKTNTTVLIRGESGTGKELLAREIHDLSGRKGSFVALNCTAISEGLAESELFGHERGAFTGAISQRSGSFEQAKAGTLFLDEVGDAPSSLQAKLLRVLERNEFTRVGGQQVLHADVRIIAATNCDLESLIQMGKFRLDLHYRLGAVSLSLPPLRERQDDLLEIVESMISELNARLKKRIRGITPASMEKLKSYSWPGNLRELYHVLRRAVLLCRTDVIDEMHLNGIAKSPVQKDKSDIPTLFEVECDHITHVLRVTSGNRGRACELLGISRPTLRRKLRRLQIHDEGLPT